MSLVYNGVTIPENIAGSLVYNGVSLTQVIFNGVAIWNQSLFNAQWSGDSLHAITSASLYGIDTSGGLYRSRYMESTNVGQWLSATADGLATGNSDTSNFNLRISTTPTTLAIKSTSTWFGTGTVSFSKSTGFSGASQCPEGQLSLYVETSGGLLRFRMSGSGTAGAWISLT